MRRTVKERFSNRRWRLGTLTGTNVTLQGVGADNRFNGVLKEVPPWWLWLWFVDVTPVTTEQFTRRKA